MPRLSRTKKNLLRLSLIRKSKKAASRPVHVQTLTKTDAGVVKNQRAEFSTAVTTTINLTTEVNDVSPSNPRTSRCNKRPYSSILEDVDESDVRQRNQHRSKSPSICSSTDTTSARQFPGKKLSSLFCCLPQCHVSAASKKMGGQSYELFPLPQLKSVRLKWALYVGDIDRFANTHPIDNCRVCELHFVDKKPTARNPFPTQNLLGSNYNGVDRSMRAVNEIETPNESTVGRGRSGEKSMVSDSPIIIESDMPRNTLKPTADVVRLSSTVADKKPGIAFNTRSSRSLVSDFQTSTPIQIAPAHTVVPNPNSRAHPTDPLVDHHSIEQRLLNSENDQALRRPSQAGGKSVANPKKHLVIVSKLPDGNIQLTAVPQRRATVTVSDPVSCPRLTNRDIKSPSLSRVTLSRPSLTARLSDAQPESSNLDGSNYVIFMGSHFEYHFPKPRCSFKYNGFKPALISSPSPQLPSQTILVHLLPVISSLTEPFVPATPQTTNYVSASINYSDKQRQSENLRNPCEHCGDRLDEIKKNLKRLEEKFDSMLTVFSTFLLTTTPLETQNTTNDIATNRTPPIAPKLSVLPSGGASLQAQPMNANLQSGTSSIVRNSTPITQRKRPVTTIVVNNMNTRQKSIVHSLSKKANCSDTIHVLKQKDVTQLPQPGVEIQSPKQIPNLRMPDEIMPILYPATFKDKDVSTTNKQQTKAVIHFSEKSKEIRENKVLAKNSEKRTISDDDPELIIECEMEVDENFVENRASKDKISNIENQEKEKDEDNIGPLIIDENDNEFGEESTNVSNNVVETPPTSNPVSQRIVNQAVVRAALLFAGRGLSVDHMKTCGPSWLGGIPDNEIDEALKYLVNIGLIESIGVREFSEASPRYESNIWNLKMDTATRSPKLKIEAFRKHLPDEQREKSLLDCGVHLSAFLQAYNRKPSSKTEQLNEFCNS